MYNKKPEAVSICTPVDNVENEKTTAVRSRTLSKLIVASCVEYFDRAYYGFCGEQNLTKSDNIRQNLTAVELRVEYTYVVSHLRYTPYIM